MEKQEIWRDLPDWEDKYEISNYGNVRSKDRYVKGRIPGYPNFRRSQPIKTHKHKSGYYAFTVQSQQRKPTTLYVHRMVAEAFIPNEENHPDVIHLDKDLSHNHVSNLQWVPEGYHLTIKGQRRGYPIYEYTYPALEHTITYLNMMDFLRLNPDKARQGIYSVFNGKSKHYKGYFYSPKELTQGEIDKVHAEFYKVHVYTYPDLKYLNSHMRIMDVAKAYGLNKSNCSRCAKGFAYQVMGYHISYERYTPEREQEVKNSFYKVFQYTPEKELVRKYLLFQDTKEYGFNTSSVRDAIDGGTLYKGFLWVEELL